MTSALLDTNVLASGIIGLERPWSVPGRILHRWRVGEFRLVVSEQIMVELERTLTQLYFARQLQPEISREFLAALQTDAEFQHIETPVPVIATHPEDDLVIAAAVGAQVSWLVTGDKQMLRLGEVGNIPIVSPHAFLMMFGA